MFIKFVEDAQHCIVRTDVPTSATATKAAHQPAYLRSFKLPTPKAAIAPKVTLALSELGISHSRLVMPTRENVVQFEALLDAATALIEIKRLVDKVDYDIKVSRNRLGLREKSQSVGDGEPKMENDDAMDIDYTQGDEIEEGVGRGESVVSGRSRKHVSGLSNRYCLNFELVLVTALPIRFFWRHHCNFVYKSRYKTSETQLKRYMSIILCVKFTSSS